MSKIAVFPGSYDPFTKGHQAIVASAIDLFDEIVIAIGINTNKSYLYSMDQRIDFIKRVYPNEPKIRVQAYSGLTVDYCIEIGSKFILRGLRTSADFEFERGIAQMNKDLCPEVETMFLLAPVHLSAVSSTIVRDIIRNGGDASQFVPEEIQL